MSYMTRIERQKHGDIVKRRLENLAASADKAGRLKIKIALMEGGAAETTARLLMLGTYDKIPGVDLIENMEGVLARFGKAKAS